MNHQKLRYEFFILVIILLLLPISHAVTFPSPQKYVVDSANVIEPEWKDKITSLARQIEDETTAEIAVVTIDNLQGITKEEYAVTLFNEWGIGKKEKDNGILILTAMQEREWKIEIGYGLEGTINDAKAGDIGRTYITPYFKQEKYGEGLYLTVENFGKLIKGEPLSNSDSNPSDNDFFGISWYWIIGGIALFYIFTRKSSRESSESYEKLEKEYWAYPHLCPFCGYKITKKEIEDKKVCPKCGKRLLRKKKKRDDKEEDFIFIPIIVSSSGYGGGGSGGGGGGFGGGGSGGGGAGGGW